jgi:hypothetical protein
VKAWLKKVWKAIPWAQVKQVIAVGAGVGIGAAQANNPHGIPLAGITIGWDTVWIVAGLLGITHVGRNAIPDKQLQQIPIIGDVLQTGDGTGTKPLTKEAGGEAGMSTAQIDKFNIRKEENK